jgi:hypothetical protein
MDRREDQSSVATAEDRAECGLWPERGPLQAAAQEPACSDRRRFTTGRRGTAAKLI